VARIIVLDASPLALSCHNPKKREVQEIRLWRIRAQANGAIVVIPEIADYEVRRELIRAELSAAVKRLDALGKELRYAPLTTNIMRKAAELWAGLRRQGLPTADIKTLDADMIVAAQAMDFAGLGDDLTVATDNLSHLSRLPVGAKKWEDIIP
jgi:predicted nucleic acid-binding protein